MQTDGLDAQSSETHRVRLRELGELLRRAREDQNITVAQAVEATKVRARYLLAIEAGDLSVLPGKVYARGFIRSYADYLGLAGKELTNLYLGIARDEELPHEAQASVNRKVQETAYVQATPVRSRAKQRQVQGKPSGNDANFGRGVLRLAGAVVIFTLLVVLYAAFSHHSASGVGSAQAVAPASGSQPGASGTGVVKPSGSTKTPQGKVAPASGKPIHGHNTAGHKATGVSGAGSKQTAATITEVSQGSNFEQFRVAAGGPLSLVFSTPNGRCWVQTTADGRVINSATLAQGQTVKWTAQQSISVFVGNMPAVRVAVDGQPVALAPATSGFTYTFSKSVASAK